MSFAQTVALGALAGFTIYIGLPVGRLQLMGRRARVALAMFSVGVLAFIFVDVLSHASAIVNDSAGRGQAPSGLGLRIWSGWSDCWPSASRPGAPDWRLVERRMRPLGTRSPRSPAARAPPRSGRRRDRAAAAEVEAARRRALRTGLTIAGAIGVHNFAEGLAIGVSARAGAISLATVLIIGFALHNATEGFGIIGPLGDVTPIVALARPGRTDRRRPDVPGLDGRLHGDQ